MADAPKVMIVAVDGPAGSGKSTVAKRLAKKLGLLYLDTGAMYRALTVKAMRSNIRLDDESSLTDLARSTKLDLIDGPDLKVMLDGEDVAGEIRTPEVTRTIRFIARVPGVRAEMVRLQRSIGARRGAVLEGRDIGTVVFPEANYKFYLDADIEERARRRQKELDVAGKQVPLDAVIRDMTARDDSDMNRAVGALKQASDAVRIDTTRLTIDDVVDKALGCINAHKCS